MKGDCGMNWTIDSLIILKQCWASRISNVIREREHLLLPINFIFITFLSYFVSQKGSTYRMSLIPLYLAILSSVLTNPIPDPLVLLSMSTTPALTVHCPPDRVINHQIFYPCVVCQDSMYTSISANIDQLVTYLLILCSPCRTTFTATRPTGWGLALQQPSMELQLRPSASLWVWFFFFCQFSSLIFLNWLCPPSSTWQWLTFFPNFTILYLPIQTPLSTF